MKKLHDRSAIFAVLFFFGICCLTRSAECQTSARQRFDEGVKKWRQCCKDAFRASQEFQLCDEADAAGWRDKWKQAKAEGDKQKQIVLDAAVDLFKANQVGDDFEIRFLMPRIFQLRYESGDYTGAYEISSIVVEVAGDAPQVLHQHATIEYSLNSFRKAKDLFAKAKKIGKELPPQSERMLSMMDTMIEDWDKEQELRATEAKANDLPRVKFILNQDGQEREIVFELFENEAPNTVANFISLVESGYYNGKRFDTVVNHVTARVGRFDRYFDDLPYVIESETKNPNARKIFRGTLAMGNMGKNTDYSQIFISYIPHPTMNGKFTAFGRVIDGMDVADKLPRTGGYGEGGKFVEFRNVAPGVIVRAEVIRKRDHDYKPETKPYQSPLGK